MPGRTCIGLSADRASKTTRWLPLNRHVIPQMCHHFDTTVNGVARFSTHGRFQTVARRAIE